VPGEAEFVGLGDNVGVGDGLGDIVGLGDGVAVGGGDGATEPMPPSNDPIPHPTTAAATRTATRTDRRPILVELFPPVIQLF
jgi:hypothetical protein